MLTNDKLLTYGFVAFSVISSFLFVFYAVNVNSNPASSDWLKIFAYVAGGYGLFNIYILSWAWRSRAAWANTAELVIAACFLGVFTMDSLKDGLQRPGAELGSLIGLAAILWINWQAVKKASSREVHDG